MGTGVFQLQSKPADIMRSAADASAQLCRAVLGQAPKITVEDHVTSDMSFSCVPIHLQYVLTELMKNACRATVERHGHFGFDDELPPVQCHVVSNSAEIIINIKDHGGGIPRGKMANVWKFLYSTSKVRPWNAKRFDCRQ